LATSVRATGTRGQKRATERNPLVTENANQASDTAGNRPEAAHQVGSAAWVQETAGWLTPPERRSLLLPLARTHLRNAAGRLSLAVGVNSGRLAHIPPARLVPPNTVLTRAAAETAATVLPVALLNHSHRTYAFGRALGELEGVDVDTELLFAASLLHDIGLVTSTSPADFTLASIRVARQVAERVGLSTAATATMQTAITMHHSPGVDLSVGPVAYLLSAGAGVDVVGLGVWQLPDSTVADTLAAYPRHEFKNAFGSVFRQEAARVPRGRTRFLYRYGAFGAAIRFAPFDQ
jgi:hypothetical protein